MIWERVDSDPETYRGSYGRGRIYAERISEAEWSVSHQIGEAPNARVRSQVFQGSLEQMKAMAELRAA